MKHQILCLLAALSVVISLPAKPSGHLAHAAAQNAAVQLSATAPHDTQSLKKRVKELLDNEIFERTLVGIYIYDLTDDRPVFMHNERQCMRPASNEKIVTAVTALRRLGTDYLLGTELYARRPTRKARRNYGFAAATIPCSAQRTCRLLCRNFRK